MLSSFLKVTGGCGPPVTLYQGRVMIGEEEEIPINHRGAFCVFGTVWCVEGICSNCYLAIEWKKSSDRVTTEVNEILFKADKAST